MFRESRIFRDNGDRGAGGVFAEAGRITRSARVSPFRYVIDAMRQAYQGHYLNTIMVEGIAVAVGMAVVFLFLGSRVFLRENA
jgi:ABC-2 type transport system permease protein